MLAATYLGCNTSGKLEPWAMEIVDRLLRVPLIMDYQFECDITVGPDEVCAEFAPTFTKEDLLTALLQFSEIAPTNPTTVQISQNGWRISIEHINEGFVTFYVDNS
jgi:hypothetical protein